MATIAWLSAFPPARSGTARYAAELLPRVMARHDVTVYRDPAYLPAIHVPPHEIPRVGEFRGREDLALYHVGADWHSTRFLWRALDRHPGLVVLHDFSLHDLASVAWRGRPVAFLGHFLKWEGREGFEALTRDDAGRRRWSPLAWYRRLTTHERRRELFPANTRLLRRARGVVVHSVWAARAVKRVSPDTRVFLVPHGVSGPLTEESPAAARVGLEFERFGIDRDTFVVAMAGNFHPSKRLIAALRGIRHFARSRKDAKVKILLLGRPTPGYDPSREIEDLGLDGLLHVIERPLALWELHRVLRASDAFVGLRDPGLGATPGSLLTALVVGTPTIVSDVAPLHELPANHRVPVGPGEEEALAAALADIADHPRAAALTAQAAADLVLERHSWTLAAREFLSAVDAILGDPAGGRGRPALPAP